MFRPMASPSFSSDWPTISPPALQNLKTSFQQKVVPQLCQHCPDSSLLPLYTQSIQFLQILVSTLSLPPRFLCFVYKTSRVSTSIYLEESMALQIGIFFAFSRDFHYFHKCFDFHQLLNASPVSSHPCPLLLCCPRLRKEDGDHLTESTSPE